MKLISLLKVAEFNVDILRVSIDKNDLVVENSTKTLCVQVPNLELANKFKSDVEKFKTKQVGE